VTNEDIGAAQRFHDGTYYPGGDFLREWPTLDAATRPLPYKVYSTFEPHPLPTSFSPSPAPSFDVVTDLGRAAHDSLGDVYLIVNAVDGLVSGTYRFHRNAGSLEQLTVGDFRTEAHHLALDQDLGGDAAVNIYVMADLPKTLALYGDRGYRAAQLLPAVFAGKVYLASYALGLGAIGLTFWDNDVTEFLSPHAAAKSPMFLVAVGHKARGRGS
jgi:hypothetical protein